MTTPRSGHRAGSTPSWRLHSSPIQPFMLPDYAEGLAQALQCGALRYVPSRPTSFDPRALLFVDEEAVEGDSESSGSESGSSDCSMFSV